MKIALCLFGLTGGITDKNGNGEKLNPSVAYNFYKKNIIENQNVDVFIHSWSNSFKKELVEIYNPKKFIIEDQIAFPESYKHPSVIEEIKNSTIKKTIKSFLKGENKKKRISNSKLYSFRAHSRWYSSKMSISLKKTYEKENNFEYDFVMVSRLDLGIFKKIDFSKLEKNVFYAGHRNNAPNKNNNFKGDYNNENKNFEFNDLFFIGSSGDLDKFSKLFDYINCYKISPHASSYSHTIKYVKPKQIKYLLYRWFDFELIRRKLYDSRK